MARTKAKSKRSVRGSSRRSNKKKSTINVDLSDVETRKVVAEGEYLLEVDEVNINPGDEYDYISLKIKIEGGGVAYENLSLSPKALWKLRQYLESFGYDIPDSAFDLDPKELVGLTCGGIVDMDTHEGTRKNVIVDVFPEAELDEDREVEDDPPKKKSKKKVQEEEDDEDEEDDEENDEEDDEEDDEDEEDEPPKKKRKSRGKKSGTIKKGSKVSFEDDGEEYEGKVIKASRDGVCEVEVEDEIWELEKDDLTLI